MVLAGNPGICVHYNDGQLPAGVQLHENDQSEPVSNDCTAPEDESDLSEYRFLDLDKQIVNWFTAYAVKLMPKD